MVVYYLRVGISPFWFMQFVMAWVMPYKPPGLYFTNFDAKAISKVKKLYSSFYFDDCSLTDTELMGPYSFWIPSVIPIKVNHSSTHIL